ncbi:MAG: guanylate kinase [Steroidobacteraceae bacterium]
MANNDAADAARGRGRLFVIAAPSGAGKTSLVKALVEREPELQFSVSYTTRQPRPNERDGADYHFVSAQQFQAMVANNEFLEHARVFDNHYGTSMSTVQQALAAGRQLLLEIDWQGARQVRARLPEAHSIFILPPSLKSLELRLRQRSTDSEEVIRRRLQDSVLDLAHWSEFEFVVVNDQFEAALDDLQEIVRSGGETVRAKRPEIERLAAELVA